MNRATARRPLRLMAVLLLFSCASGLFCPACSDKTEPLHQSSFERPEGVAFVCFDSDENGTAVSPRPLQECATRNERLLYALVTQTSRGEVAAVDINRAKVIDSQPEIPGYTFVPVGQIPKAVAVPAGHPETTYVANFGSRDVTVISTRAFLPGASAGEIAGSRTPLPGGPVDMVVSPAEDALFLAVPDAHSVVRLSLCRDPRSEEQGGQAGCTQSEDEGAVIGVEALRLPDYTSEELMQIRAAAPPPETGERYAYACGYAVSYPESRFEREPALSYTCSIPTAGEGTGAAGTGGLDAGGALDSSANTTDGPMQPDAGASGGSASCDAPRPRPVALAVDGYGMPPTRLLIADSALPIIHVIEIDGFSELVSGQQRAFPAPWVVGVPVRDVVVTPPVPVEIPVAISPTALHTATGSDAGAGLDAGDELDAGYALGAGAVFDAGIQADAGAMHEGGTTQAPDGGDGGQASIGTGPSASGSGPPGGSSGSPPDTASDFRQYAYAIDAIDGSVMAIDAWTGAVLTVGTVGAQGPDRIPLTNVVATSLEIVTPGFDSEEQFVSRCNCVRAESLSGVDFAPEPHELQGVFLAVASRNGGIHVVDIHDKRAVDLYACRHSECLNAKGDPILDKEDGEPAPATESFFAANCTSEERCSLIEEEGGVFSLQAGVPLSSEYCRTCCNKDGTRFEFEVEDACVSCRDPQGQLIAFDENRCRRCLDQAGNPVAVAIRRHRPRIANVRTYPAPESMVSFIVGGRRIVVNNTGTAESVQEHRLCRVDCSELSTMARSFPDPDWKDEPGPLADEDAGVEVESEAVCEGENGDAFVCTGIQPWRAMGEKWLAAYEGTIPGSFDARGRFVLPTHSDNLSGRLELWSDAGAFCHLGVMGGEQLAPRPGDMLVIASAPLPEPVIRAKAEDSEENPELNPNNRFVPAHCAALTEERDDGTAPRVALPIVRSFSDHLELQENLVRERGPEGLADSLLTYELVRYCTAGLPVSYQIDTRETYAVVGETSGFLHGVCAGPDGLCGTCDASLPIGRAYEKQLFDNGAIAFRLAPQENRDPTFALEIRPEAITTVSVNLGNVGSYYYTYGTLPVELRYEPVSFSLFAVDQALRGLVRIPLQPFPQSLLGATYVF